jgi:hypothetical protein
MSKIYVVKSLERVSKGFLGIFVGRFSDGDYFSGRTKHDWLSIDKIPHSINKRKNCKSEIYRQYGSLHCVEDDYQIYAEKIKYKSSCYDFTIEDLINEFKESADDFKIIFDLGQKKIMTEEIEIEHSSGNVFADLQLPDAENLLKKAKESDGSGRIISTIDLVTSAGIVDAVNVIEISELIEISEVMSKPIGMSEILKKAKEKIGRFRPTSVAHILNSAIIIKAIDEEIKQLDKNKLKKNRRKL